MDGGLRRTHKGMQSKNHDLRQPLLAAAPTTPRLILLGNLRLRLHLRRPSPLLPPSSTVSPSSAGGYNALSYKAVLSSLSLNCFPTRRFSASFPPVSPPPERSSPGEKRRGKSGVSLCLRPDQRHSSLIHEWSLVGRRIPRLRTGSSTTLFPRHQRRGTLCSTIVEESVTGRESLVRRSTWRILLFFAFYSRK